MATKTITFSLDPGSIERAAREVEKFAEQLREIIEELIKHLTEEGKTIAAVKVVEMGAVESQDLLKSIDGYYNEDLRTGFVRAKSYHAFFVEYGTGIVGGSNRHPEIEGDWAPPAITNGDKTYTEYDSYKHGAKGWWYPSDKGWYIPKKSDGTMAYAWTKGYRARPFMYQTFKELERMSADIYNELFSGR